MDEGVGGAVALAFAFGGNIEVLTGYVNISRNRTLSSNAYITNIHGKVSFNIPIDAGPSLCEVFHMADDSLTRSLQERRLYLEVGVRVRRRREELRKTQDELASAVGLSRSSIANIERGQQHAPVHVLLWLAEALGVDVGTLLPTHYELVALTTAGWDVKKQVSIGGESSGLSPDVVQLVGALLTRPSQAPARSRGRPAARRSGPSAEQPIANRARGGEVDNAPPVGTIVGTTTRAGIKRTKGD